MRFRRLVQTLHNWLGLLIAVQILLWMVSGVVMSAFPIELVRGETAAAADYPPELPVRAYFSPGGVVAETEGATRVALRMLQGRPVYEVETAFGQALFDADSGGRVVLGKDDIRAIAERDFLGEGEIEKLERMSAPPHEYRGPTPVWRASFDDRNATRLYISPATGEVLARRNWIWRFYDFFWMLHIMDYDEREDFNNPLLITFSVSGLLFALTGIALVVWRLANGSYTNDLRKASAALNRPPTDENNQKAR